MMNLCENILNSTDVAFTVRSYEAGIDNHVTLPTLCNYMQEAAGISAARLGWGIQALQSEGLTWMLSRLRVNVTRYVPWGEAVTVRTWPSGMKGRLVAKRCFLGIGPGGEEVFRASSEWLYVDIGAQKIAKLPESFAGLVPDGTPDFEFPDIGGKFAHLPSVDSGVEVLTRRSDLDFNDHVNNVHYVEWMLDNAECRIENVECTDIDISFRQAAKAGEALVSERCVADGGRMFHAIRRVADGALLATAATVSDGRAVSTKPPMDNGGVIDAALSSDFQDKEKRR